MFRFANDDEPLRYAPLRFENPHRHQNDERGCAMRRQKLKEKVGTIIIGLYFCKC